MKAQLALAGQGPAASDDFRFTWWNTQQCAAVWIEHRGSWRQGIIVERGREYVRVEIETRAGRRRRVRKSYSELRRVK